MSTQSHSAGDIAIIGMSCLFPGAPNLQAYWENIVGKVSAISDPPPGWEHGGFFEPQSPEAERLYCRRGGFLGDLACFDPLKYGVMPQSVDGAEPEHFLALRVAHEALADAGYLERPFNREKTGVILGRGTFVNRGNVTALQHTLIMNQTLRLLKQLHPEYSDEALQIIKEQLYASLPPFNVETAPGLVPNVMCGRIANRLDLRGPNYAIDAACASSLVAVDLGVQELLNERCDLVLVGGVSVASPPMLFLGFCEVGALSRNQQVRPFDAKADGTLLGEGIGMAVLKRHQDAQRDGDRIYAVIKGVGVASDGRALAVLAPRLEGEELALRRAYTAANLSPQTIELVEAHGTATPIGDLTEIQALRRVFGDRERLHPHCALGSVKSMISHTIPAAGIAGLIKTALALYHKILPPTLNCETPNPKFELEKTPFYINTETRPWIHGGREPRRAGVNAFGFGGINAHVILEEMQGTDETTALSYQRTWDSEVVILQGESRADLVTRAKRLHQYLVGNPDVQLKDLAYTFNTELQDSTLRLAIVAPSVPELEHKLAHALQRLADPARRRIKDVSGIYFFEEPLARAGAVAFVFPGEGPQYANMLADLCLHFPEIRAHFDQADRVFLDNKRPYVPSQIVFPVPLQERPDGSPLWQIDIGVASVFAANRALATLLTRLGVKPDAVVGHSSGEYAALLAAGAVEVQDEEELLQHGLDLNTLYASFADRIPAAVLVAVGVVHPNSVKSVLETCPGPLYLMADNCPHQVVLCGTRESIEPAIRALRSRGALCTVLPFRRGYHTPFFKPISQELQRFFQGIQFVPPKTTVYSCAIAQPFSTEPEEIRDLAVLQLSSPVRFRETVEGMYAAGVRIFVEVGPGGNLSGFVDDILRGKPFLSVPMNVAHRSGLEQLNHAVGLLTAHGVSLRLDYLYARRQPHRLSFEEVQPAAKKRLMPVALGLPTLHLADPKAIGTAKASPTPMPNTPVGLHRVNGSSELQKPLSGTAPSHVESPVHSSPTFADATGWTETAAVAADAGSGSIQSQPMLEYLRTMERFLDIQQEVMQAFLGGTAPTEMPSPSLSQELLHLSPELTPHSRSDFAPSAAAVTAPPSSEQGPVVVPSPALVSVDVAATPVDPPTRLLTLVSEKTGYPIEMLDLSLNLEADLGIDSIKRVEILGAFQHETGLIRPEDMEQAANLKTLQEVIDYVTKRLSITSPLSLAKELSSLTPKEESVAPCALDGRNVQFLSEPWPAVVSQLSPTANPYCCWVRPRNLPEAFFDEAHSLERDTLAQRILSPAEYTHWSLFKATEKRRTEWLLGRLVGKDAVRQFLKARNDVQLYPADIEIEADQHGAPVVRGPWTEVAGHTPSLTLAHSESMATAVVAECQPNEGIGIDIERVRDLPQEVVTGAFSAAERGLLDRLEPAVVREWVMRLWCAKEALGKALGLGLVGGPLNVLVQEFDTQTGDVAMTPTGRLAKELALPSDVVFVTYTRCEDDVVVASTLVRRPTEWCV